MPRGIRLRKTHLLAVIVFAFFAIFMLAPLLSMLANAFPLNDPLVYFRIIFGDRLFWNPNLNFEIYTESVYPQFTVHIITGVDQGILLNTLLVALLASFFSTLLGVTLAYIMARYNFRLKPLFGILLIAPSAAPPIVSAIGLKKMIGLSGTINLLLWRTWKITDGPWVIQGLAAVILVEVLHFFVIPYLNARAAFTNIDPSIEETAENLGASPIRRFFRVTLPMALPGIAAGFILTFIFSLEDIGTPIVFGDDDQATKLLTYRIFQAYQSAFLRGEMVSGHALALSVIILMLAIACFYFVRKFAEMREVAIVEIRPRTFKTGPIKYGAIHIFLIGVCFFALLPHIGVILLSVADYWTSTSPFPDQFTAQHFIDIFDPSRGVFKATVNSFVYSASAIVIILALGLSAAYLMQRTRLRGRRIIDLLVTMPIAIPGIVYGIGYFVLFFKTPISPFVGYSFFSLLVFPVLILSYSVRRFPFTVRSIYSGLQQVDSSLDDASKSLGATAFQTFKRVIAPLIFPYIIGGAMLSFIYSMSEVSTSVLFGGLEQTGGANFAPITQKIAELYGTAYAGIFLSAALGVFLMILLIVFITLANMLLKRTAAITGV
jgi:ABC-type Fe3+ transport system permease subunit